MLLNSSGAGSSSETCYLLAYSDLEVLKIMLMLSTVHTAEHNHKPKPVRPSHHFFEAFLRNKLYKQTVVNYCI